MTADPPVDPPDRAPWSDAAVDGDTMVVDADAGQQWILPARRAGGEAEGEGGGKNAGSNVEPPRLRRPARRRRPV
jgi:hypothetical protein